MLPVAGVHELPQCPMPDQTLRDEEEAAGNRAHGAFTAVSHGR